MTTRSIDLKTDHPLVGKKCIVDRYPDWPHRGEELEAAAAAQQGDTVWAKFKDDPSAYLLHRNDFEP